VDDGLISVIIPVFKTEAYLKDCVDSVRAQTYANLEIILVDDGSPDRCGELCDSYAAEYDRIKVIHKKNGGLASARNAGLCIAKGEFIAFVDSDDTIDAGMYEQMHKRMTEEGADICVCGFKMIYEGYTRIESLPHIKTYSPSELWDLYISEFRKYNTLIVSSCNKLYRRNILGRDKSNTGQEIRFPEEVVMTEDGFFVADCIDAAHHGITFLGLELYNYSQINNPLSISKVGSYKLVDNYLDYLQKKMQKSLPQKTAEIEDMIAHQKQVNLVIAVHIAIINKLKFPHRIKGKTVLAIIRRSKSRREKISATIIYLMPPPLYRAAFRLFCKLRKTR